MMPPRKPESEPSVRPSGMVSLLRECWTARRTRLLHNEKVYASEGEYARALQAAAEAKATLDAMEDVERMIAG